MSKRLKYYSLILFIFFYFIIYNFVDRNIYANIKSLSKWLESYQETPVFRLNPEELICEPISKKPILFIVFVILAPDYFDKRNLIRSTWGNKSLSSDFRLVFTIGMSKNDTINQKIQEEFNIHKDIIQIDNFTDSYFNMTTKIMKSFKWISQYCSNAQYILRINDDVVVNTFQLVSHFKRIDYKTNQIFGYRIYGVGPNRWKDNKFYVSEAEYNKSYYDDYIEGFRLILFTIL